MKERLKTKYNEQVNLRKIERERGSEVGRIIIELQWHSGILAGRIPPRLLSAGVRTDWKRLF